MIYINMHASPPFIVPIAITVHGAPWSQHGGSDGL